MSEFQRPLTGPGYHNSGTARDAAANLGTKGSRSGGYHHLRGTNLWVMLSIANWALLGAQDNNITLA